MTRLANEHAAAENYEKLVKSVIHRKTMQSLTKARQFCQTFGRLRYPSRERIHVQGFIRMHQTNQPPPRMQGPIGWKSVGLLAVVGGGVLAFYKTKEKERRELQNVTKPGKGVGRPAIGGPFELIDQNGKLRRSTDFEGKWLFIYFGFTYCPDICPNELMRMAEIITRLDKDKETAGRVEPIFITIDPERDGPSQLRDYLADWHPRMVGLTGSPERIADVCKKYRVYYSKARLGSDPKDYLIDHSIMFYLMDDKGEFVDYFGKSLTAQDIAGRVRAYMTGTATDATHSDSSIGTQAMPSTTADLAAAGGAPPRPK